MIDDSSQVSKNQLLNSKGNNKGTQFQQFSVVQYCRVPFSARKLFQIYKSHSIHFCTTTINCMNKCTDLFKMWT